jgi:hypothetical protein
MKEISYLPILRPRACFWHLTDYWSQRILSQTQMPARHPPPEFKKGTALYGAMVNRARIRSYSGPTSIFSVAQGDLNASYQDSARR